MPDPRGRKLPLSLPRRWIGDLMAAAVSVPSVIVQRQMNLADVVRARAASVPRPSWLVLFARAYALTAQQFPELRRAYMPWLFPHFYEHPVSVASVAIERDYKGEPAVFFGHLRGPENSTLESLDERVRRYREEPVESFGIFRRMIAISRLPRLLRRFMWWIGTKWSGYKRACRMGTFGISVYSGLGAESYNHITPLTTSLNYGVISPAGDVAVRIIYDHRVMDGATVARILARLEEVLNGQLVGELRLLARRPAG